MSGVFSSLVTWGEVALFQLVLIRFLRAIKYTDAPARRLMVHADLSLSVGISGVLLGLAGLHPLGGILGLLGATALFSALWLDAALYRIFTFELGAGGIFDVVLSNLASEVLEMAAARRFFRTQRTFALLPVAAFLAHLPLVLEPDSVLRSGIGAALAVYALFTLAAAPPQCAPGAQNSGTPGQRRALLLDFLLPRRPWVPADFQPRQEHEFLLAQRPALPAPSSHHGSLRGASVVLLTFESLSTAHLGAGVHTPFLSALGSAKGALGSRNHFCLAPLTNAAHTALYFSSYTSDGNEAATFLRALQRAGYETIYLTAATVEHYGLAAILARAGFRHIIDGKRLSEQLGSSQLGAVSDSVLLTAGLAAIRALLGRRGKPFFIHVHATNSHIPYRTSDPVRFCRHDAADDRGRFLNAIEETDWIFGELWAALQALAHGDADEPLLLVSADHGQAFGEHGYFSHGSAVIREEINVPLLLHHSKLAWLPELSDSAPRSIRFSTHFDVLPTILDLVGVQASHLGFGSSMFHTQRSLGHLLWDGKPSRSTCGCLGLLLGERKYALDLIRGTCQESDWQDGNMRMLDGEDRSYFEALIGLVAEKRGVN